MSQNGGGRMAILGFDVGYKKIRYAVVEDDGCISGEGAFSTPDSLRDFYQCISDLSSEIVGQYDICGAGFSLPGAVDNKTGFVSGRTAISYLHGFNIRRDLQNLLLLPVVMENAANCAALGEAWAGAGMDYQDMVYLSVGHGIGGAMVKNKQVIAGVHRYGGGFGYAVMNEEGETLDEVASPFAVAGKLSLKKGLPENAISSHQAFEMMEAGDHDAMEAIESMYGYLAQAIYNVQYTYDPEVFVIGGAVTARQDFVENIRRHLERLCRRRRATSLIPNVVACDSELDSTLLGLVSNFMMVMES